jgi:5'-3' exonuclease
MDKVLIIDFMNYVHRCRVGSLDGEFVLIFNFFRNLRATVDQFKPYKIFFALEGHPKHRYELLESYKANRIIKNAAKQTTADNILLLANKIKELLLLLPVTLISHSDFEADDIINTLCFNLKEEDIIICSSDSDCIQILQLNYKNCKLYNPIKKEFLVAPPYPYVAWKCLAGDKSDNIPSLLTPKKVIKCMEDPAAFQSFLSTEENRANFNINRQLIEFRTVPEEEISLTEGISNFDALRIEFMKMKFESITNDKSWEKYVKTFSCINL